MTLIKSISGIRGTIGGYPGDNLSPFDIVKYASAYAVWIKENHKSKNKIVIGRDARISGEMLENLVVSSLVSLGLNVVKIGLASTPTTEFAVCREKAAGGIIITASHNPKNWNALKLLNEKGEFLNDLDGKRILEIAENHNILFSEVDELGKISEISEYEDLHIDSILSLKTVNKEAISKAKFSIAIDCVNSVGGIAIPKLLNKLGISKIHCINCKPDGEFSHDPEPLAENLSEISNFIKVQTVDLGFVVDPDVDRLAIICENGEMFGEEYTLVAIADYILAKTPGNTVSNLSSTRALRDITEMYGMRYDGAAVGEVNVVAKMKETNAVIGGEGNGGVIYPEAHYGRDALVGIALFLSLLAEKKLKVTEIKASLPQYFISKNKIQLNKDINVDKILKTIEEKYKKQPLQTIDGLKIEFPETKEWIHLRKSNTEAIIRIYSESNSLEKANKLAAKIIEEIENIIH